MIDDATARVRNWLGNASLHRRLAFILAAISVLSGVLTIAVMTDPGAVQERAGIIRWLVYLDGVLFLMLSVTVARRLVRLWQNRQKGSTGAGLQGRLVMLFSLIAVTPALLVAVFSYLFLNFGLEAWFSDRVTSALRESVGVTEAYLKEHRANIANQTYSVAYVLDQNAPALARNPWQFNNVLSANASARDLPEAVVIDRLSNIIARSDFALSTAIEEVPSEAFDQADQGEVALLSSERAEKIRALVRLNRFVEAYLLVEKFVDPRVIQHITGIRQAFDEYTQLQATRSGVQFSFVLIYMIAVMILLMAAIWVGMTVSAQMAEPLTDLIDAAERISKGDLKARVETTDSPDEIGLLSRSFNNMAARIFSQQQGLITANTELDERRRFTEAVLSGVTAGVVGLNADGRLDLPNRSASELLGKDLTGHIGEPFTNIVPELKGILTDAHQGIDFLHHAEIPIKVADVQKTFLVRVAVERIEDGSVAGFVVTFDDVTALLSAQRKAAWADVARRIAHEIKNPLTPIQLSAERLQRKYLKEIETDPDTYKRLIETIIRQVGDIGRMVDEFSSFARMPLPQMKRENLSELCRQAAFLERNREIKVAIDLDLPQDDIYISCDARQVSRVLTNIIKNATESIEGAREGGAEVEGRIDISIRHSADGRIAEVIVEDDGRGLPADERDRLTEPYVTTREKGTGLGLAIVKKIMEEHGGVLMLGDRQPRGARVTLRFATGSVTDEEPDKYGASAEAVASSAKKG